MARQVATGLVSITAPPGYVSDLHPAPREQWMIITSGTAEIIVSDGEKRMLPTGSILYLEEIGSKGHLTNVIGDEQLILMVVEID
jgi:oxalate decarboxylase/phosphoglucose isomerase-like protein (cupin superfamily)